MLAVQDEGSGGVGLLEASLFGLQVGAFSLHPHMVSLCAVLGVCNKGTPLTGLGPSRITSFNCNYLFNGPVFKHSDIGD